MEEVDCAECGNRYDSQTNAFCPRCGNSRQKAATSSLQPARFDPRRRRAQIGGIILAVLGTFALIQAAWSAIAPAELDEEQLDGFAEVALLRDQPGGELHIRWLESGAPVQGNVSFVGANGDPLANITLQNGWSNLTADVAFGNATLQGSNLTVSFYAPAGQTVTAIIDTAEPPTWVAVDQVPATRIIASFLAFFAAFVAFGGILAIRLKAWGLAVAAGVVALVPAVILALLVPVAGILLAFTTGLALAFIIAGRRHF